MEKMLQIVRFVETQCNSVEIKDPFINFIPPDVKTAEIIKRETTDKLG
jgi:hypothetical protein